MNRRLGDDPEAALASEHHLADARSVRGCRDRPRDERPRRRDHAQPLGHVRDVPVTVGLHPGRPRGDPAAQRRVRERVREVAERVPAGLELVLEVGPEHACLHARQPRARVDIEHLVEPLEVERDHRPRLGRRRLQRAGDRRAATERDHDGIEPHRRLEDRGHLVLAAGTDYRIWNPRKVPGALPHQIAQRLAARVDDAVERVEREVPPRDGLLERLPQVVRERRIGDLELIEPQRRRSLPPDVDADRLEDERRQSGLVLVRELDPLLTPSPPLHRSHNSPSLAVLGAGSMPGVLPQRSRSGPMLQRWPHGGRADLVGLAYDYSDRAAPNPSVRRRARGHEHVVARGELPVGRADLPARQSPAPRAAPPRAHQASVARPLGHDSRAELPLRTHEPGDP